MGFLGALQADRVGDREVHKYPNTPHWPSSCSGLGGQCRHTFHMEGLSFDKRETSRLAVLHSQQWSMAHLSRVFERHWSLGPVHNKVIPYGPGGVQEVLWDP